ncbi:MAG: DUF4250 domain-containing protein [Clostridia bacterium]|nr:DUF4250 domain-containing protein [Clostridia bacterium]
MLPSDPIMLLSVVNMKLRDSYASLDALCDDLDVSEADITAALAGIGYAYSKERNQFV